MVSYGFYTDTYLGSRLGEKEFPFLAARAADYLESLQRRYQVACPGTDSRDMAICALAETLKQFDGRQGLAGTTVGGVSVRYETGHARALERELQRCAGVYLDIYRGVS